MVSEFSKDFHQLIVPKYSHVSFKNLNENQEIFSKIKDLPKLIKNSPKTFLLHEITIRRILLDAEMTFSWNW